MKGMPPRMPFIMSWSWFKKLAVRKYQSNTLHEHSLFMAQNGLKMLHNHTLCLVCNRVQLIMQEKTKT